MFFSDTVRQIFLNLCCLIFCSIFLKHGYNQIYLFLYESELIPAVNALNDSFWAPLVMMMF